MINYLRLLEDVLVNGQEKSDRTGTGTLSVFGRQLRFNLTEGFPLITTKKMHVKSIIHELLWFISGKTNIRYLQKNGVSIWDEWANEKGELGPVYGSQWRAWKSVEGRLIDQLSSVIEQIKINPHSRRLLVNSWNVGELSSMALPPCHYAFQFSVTANKLSCLFNMRSVDVFLGLPFNIASYALLTAMVAEQCDLAPLEIIWTGGDVHLYRNHIDQAKIQLDRIPYDLPELIIKRRPENISSYRHEDFLIKNYRFHPPISAPISV
ncbi:MAG: thymidylate synthase [Methylococcales bacterium]